MKDIPKLIYAIIICQLAGFVGSLFTSSAIPVWYASLQKASFNPPNWIFGPVWTLLFLLMGVSLYLIWIKKKIPNIFWIQLGLNVLWSILFFGFKSPLLAFIDIIALWAAIFLTIKAFYKISRTASYLLIPYILWVSFAALLNIMIVILN